VTRLGGKVLFTEHMRAARFDEFVGEIAASALQVDQVSFRHDRLWYQFESWFRAIDHWRIARAAKRSRLIGKALLALGSLLGRRGARHICVRATRHG
jgi:hypothetical protein